MKWQVITQPDDETRDWAAWCPQLPGCAAAGRTREETLTNIREAIGVYLEIDEDAVPPGAEVHQVDMT